MLSRISEEATTGLIIICRVVKPAIIIDGTICLKKFNGSLKSAFGQKHK